MLMSTYLSVIIDKHTIFLFLNGTMVLFTCREVDGTVAVGCKIYTHTDKAGQYVYSNIYIIIIIMYMYIYM